MVVFDMAGTTIKDNDAVHQALIEAMNKFGYLVNRDEANSVMGYPKPEAIRNLLISKESDKSLVQNTGYVEFIHNEFLKEMKKHYRNSTIEPTPFALEIFQYLRSKGIKVCLDTGFSKDITEVVLGRLGWLENGIIDHSISSDEVDAGRPLPFMIQALMKKCGVENSKEVAKVGDTIADLEEGNNAKVGLNIGVCNGAFTKDELAKCPFFTHLVADLGELKSIIE